MIISFHDSATEDIFNGIQSRLARRICPELVWGVARRKLDMLNQAVTLLDLRIPPGNRLESLDGDRRGQYSIRINGQYRICFLWTDQGPADVEIVDYHLR